METRSTPKRYTQKQLNKMFAEMSGKHPSKLAYAIWNNPKDPASLRLSLPGYKFVLQELKLKAYIFEMTTVLANKNLLQLERFFQGMYYLIGAHKIAVFDEQEAAMLSLMDGNLASYLNNLESNG